MRELTNKTYKSYEKLSRYASFPYYFDTEAQKYSYGAVAYLDTQISYTLHKVEQFDTWDSLASYYYNNPTYFWVLCNFNRISDPFKNPEIGTFIKIPAFSEIKFES